MYVDAINTVKDVRAFFNYLIEVEKLNFHPDEDFSDYVSTETGLSTFSNSEAEHYNSLMNRAFDVCQDVSTEIYDLAIDCLKRKMS
ncbi:MAG: hypothetical protein KAS32_27170 [Candidatus Peribacteraceae bacterium]|nr:hypothetical protein [Candidatus Peribacteraceae bacterium]